MSFQDRTFLRWAKTTLVLVYLVIVAGALVRMTGSGMGCPDWPKCFGYYIPPTDIEQLTWAPGREFEKGQVIIHDEALWVAERDFITGETYNPSNWRAYTKHDYAIFNATHTWIEYLNRLTGALAGLATLIMAVLSVRLWKQDRILTVLAWLAVFAMGFQGWLGATVVYSVLNPVKITLHMVVALFIVVLLLYIIRRANPKEGHFRYDKAFSGALWLALALSLVQVVLGTQVRQFVDEQVKLTGYDATEHWLANPDPTFYIHRSFSILVIAVAVFLFYRNRKLELGFGKINWVAVVIAMEAASGFVMYYFDFPFGTQAVHLVMASILFGLQFYLILESKTAQKTA